ncbi:MAG TPA: EpsI family protein [Methylotenera sp.]|nr:EpsI family protein [Methylotenera sp.]HPH06638.1 EpsI family protein [Methylotenera sp.]HPM49009.1 EpsI family protein [Methylotenera sp.]
MNHSTRNIFLLALMVVASVLAIALKPTIRMADSGPKINLESLIPKQFGQWKIDETISNGIVNPEVANQLDIIYNQTLSRTYRNENGQLVMLSIAYGGNQSRDFQVHRPETCYAAQGFKIESKVKGLLSTPAGDIPVMRIVANQGQRVEPITYWIRIGEKPLRGNLEQGFARLFYGLQGKVADGLLFRVSSLSSSSAEAYNIQSKFVGELLSAVPSAERSKLIGKI